MNVLRVSVSRMKEGDGLEIEQCAFVRLRTSGQGTWDGWSDRRRSGLRLG